MNEAPCVLLIERQDFWRQRCAAALRDRGYSVVQVDAYDPRGRASAPEPADLVVLGCTTVGAQEVGLVGEIRRRSQPVVLVCTRVEPRGLRAGLSAGAGDVVPRPYEPAEIVATVDRALAAAGERRP